MLLRSRDEEALQQTCFKNAHWGFGDRRTIRDKSQTEVMSVRRKSLAISKTILMFNKLGILFAILLVIAGLVLLFDPIFGADANQTVRLLAGAALVSFGSLTILLVLKDWLYGRREYKRAQNRLQG